MRALVFLAAVAGVAGQAALRAYAQDTEAAGPDFTGFYIGASRPISEPDVYPFTPHGRRLHDAYDPLTGDPRQYDDCAEELSLIHI